VRFKYLSVQGSIIVEPGSTVSAVEGITAGVSITAKTIFSALHITAVKGIKVVKRITAGVTKGKKA